MKGHAGKILVLDLTNGKADTIPTKNYEEYVGGVGLGTALFWDAIDKDYLANCANSSGLEPENIVCIMSGPLQGTLAPNGGRTEVCGVGPEAYPRPQFVRSNFGGRFSPMLKFAGWDGIIVTGKATKPVWVDIRDQKITIRSADDLWGLGTWATQEEIWRQMNSEGYTNWYSADGTREPMTTQRSAILTIGPAGENLGRASCLIHDAGNAAGTGGFGGVFGSKNLKAISVLGTGSVEVADPMALLEARKWIVEYNYDVDSGQKKTYANGPGSPPAVGSLYGAYYGGLDGTFGRVMGCMGCTRDCRSNFTQDELPGGETQCVEAVFYKVEDMKRHGKPTKAGYMATQLVQDFGIGAYLAWLALPWLESLHERGLLGKGKRIETDLDFSLLGTEEFVHEYLRKIAYKEDIGADLADGLPLAAAKWGLLEEDLMSGNLKLIYWIGDVHHGDAIHWAYQSIFTGRDINQHDLVSSAKQKVPPNQKPHVSAKLMAERMAELGAPWHDPRMITQGENDVYSIHMARVVAWHRRYSHFWKNSTLFCDWWVPSFFIIDNPDDRGLSPELETRFFKAVTGKELSYEEGLEIGRKIWNLERAILVLQGRHRDEEYFPPFPPYDSYVYTDEPPFINPFQYPVYDEEKDEYRWEVGNFPLRKDKMDEFKTLYYDLEGWDAKTGRPTKKTLEECGLNDVAKELEARGLII